jgi:thiol-disulfide isomerase/thioredoxin
MHVVKIGAAWCSGCLVMRPRWTEIEKELPWLETEYLDYDEDNEKVIELGINSNTLPTFIFFDKNNNILETLSGEIPKKDLLETIKKYDGE